MHLLQGTLDTSTELLSSGAATVALGVALYGARRQNSSKEVPALLGVTGFVFLAQMLNFSTGMGFSCHLIGASLLVIMFGPFAAMLSLGVVLTLQAALMGDGSMSTLGANFLTMGVVAPLAAYALLRGIRRYGFFVGGGVGQAVGLAVASFASIIAASLSLHLMIGGSIWSMLSMASVWGLMESLIAVAASLLCMREEAQSDRLNGPGMPRVRVAFGPLALIVCLTLCVVPFSSQEPDGLEYQLATLESAIK